MKSILSTIALLISTQVFAAPSLVAQYIQHPGFMPHPTTLTVSLLSDGTVVSEVQEMRGDAVKRETLAKLTSVAMKNLSELIQNIPADGKLVDREEGQPQCTDAPSTEISIMKNNRKVTTYTWVGCHTSVLEDGYSSSVNTLMNAFVILAR